MNPTTLNPLNPLNILNPLNLLNIPMNLSRRFFIGGATAFGAFGGNRFFEAFGAAVPSGKPNLKFGVVSDIHITKVGADEKMEAWGNNLTFKHTLEWFRDQGVDAVMIVGDMADNGMVEQMQAVAQAWFAVFPEDKAPDGRRVEKLFVMGNHDYHGYLYGDHAKKRYEKEAKDKMDYAAWCKEHVLRTDMAGWWKKIFHEDYSRFYQKTIKGYNFLGAHWDDGTGMETGGGHNTFGVELSAFLNEKGSTLDPKLPFFYFQHPHPKDTCYGSWAWGHDNGTVTKALSAFPNAIAFSGHSHYSLTDERSIWQGAFTSVGTSSLRYSGMPYNARHPMGYENTTTEAKGRDALDALKMMPKFSGGDCRQGMLWSVYDDCIVVQRREFLSDLSVGPDWVLPLSTALSKPYSITARAQKAKSPAFASGAQVELKKGKGKTRKTASIPSVEKEAYKLTIPAALAVEDARPHEYEIAAEKADGTPVLAADGKPATFYVMAEGYNHALAHPKAKSASKCILSVDRIPVGTEVLAVRPLDSFWNKGAPLRVKV